MTRRNEVREHRGYDSREMRAAYREPDEAPDDRPLVRRHPFWRSESERLTYEHAVESNPRREGEGVMSYATRIAGIVAKRQGKVGQTKATLSMPEVRLPYKDDGEDES